MKVKSRRMESVQAILVAIAAALILRQFVIAAYKIPTPSMEDTLLVGDFLLVNKFYYGAQTPHWIGIPFTRLGFDVPSLRFPAVAKPKKGDIVVFRYPLDPHLDYIKRCVATEGMKVEVRNKELYVSGERFTDPPGLKYVDPYVYSRYGYGSFQTFQEGLGSRDNFGPVTV
ncbi:MAG: signal peptidase I, partial [Calditrichia bacterium]